MKQTDRNDKTENKVIRGRFSKTIKPRPGYIIAFAIGCIGIALLVYGAVGWYQNSGTKIVEKQIDSVRISDVSVSNITDKSATLSWTTSEPAITTVLIYNEKINYSRRYNDTTAAISHTILIDELIPGTPYNYRLFIESPTDIISAVENYFTTLAAAVNQILISNVRVIDITEFGATVLWTTNKPGSSEVEYWRSGSVERRTMSSDKLTTVHNVILSGLIQDATYHFVIRSIDSDGVKAQSENTGTFILAVAPVVGKQAPDFTLNSLNGKSITLSDYQGKVVMLDFWRASCPGCREKMPLIQNAFSRISPAKIVILCVNVGEREPLIQSLAMNGKWTVPIVLDQDEVVGVRYRISGFPTTFFIDADGIVRMIDAEFDNATELENLLNSMIKDPESGGK